MLSDKITSFFFLKEEKVAFNEKKKKPNGYLKIFIHHYKNMFYIFKKKQASSHLKKLYNIQRNVIHD